MVTGGREAQMAAQVWRCHHIKHSHQAHLNTLSYASIFAHALHQIRRPESYDFKILFFFLYLSFLPYICQEVELSAALFC